MPATVENKTDPALSPKETEQIICSCSNLMKKEQSSWMENNGGFSGKTEKLASESEGLKCEADAAKGRLRRGL